MAGERILVVEDERAVARGLEYGLTREGFTVLLAEDGPRALELARRRQPDAILLDVRLPGMSGFDVCQQLRREGRRQPVLMLTARDEELDKVLGLELGADDYVVKPFALREVVARIRALLRRASGDLAQPPNDERLIFGDLEVDLGRFCVARAGRTIELTPTEFRILRYLALSPGRPFTRAQLIQEVWGYDSEVENDRTVDVHVRHLRAKIEDDAANPRFIQTVRGLGYKLGRPT
ncbi:MAG TPA: response regulator transcription factor [Chloroflexota bacterium]|nr:response regulator transcription factor [Chloroflexota bacterium]